MNGFEKRIVETFHHYDELLFLGQGGSGRYGQSRRGE
jgi:hypothetical protein